jgi:hypothetical protein
MPPNASSDASRRSQGAACVLPVSSNGGPDLPAQRALLPVVLAAAAGATLWFAASLLTGRREPWDAASYWTVVYPLALLVCVLLGYAYPRHCWRWAVALFAAEFVAMCLRNGELGSLWPLGLALFGVLALPGILASRLGARLRGRFDRGHRTGGSA